MKKTPDSIRKAAIDDKQHSPEEPTRQSMPENNDSADDALDFVVTEAHEQTSDLVGGYRPAEEDLGIESNSDLIQKEALANASDLERSAVYQGSQIGDSDPPLPTASPDEAFAPTPDPSPAEQLDSPPPSGSLEKLSESRLQEISEKMRGEELSGQYLTDSEKQTLLSNIENLPAAEAELSSAFDNRPIVPPSKMADTKSAPSDIKLTGEKPPIARRSRGVAHFAKGYIKIAGEQELHENDEMIINGREYLLRKKNLGSRNIIAVVGTLAAVAMFALGTLLSPDADTGAGSIVGIVLDSQDQPRLTGAVIHFPELGATVEASGQGFFMSDQLDPGSYKIEYIVDEVVVGTDYATVVNDRITTIIMRPDQPEPVSLTRRQARTTTPQQTRSTPDPVEATALSPARTPQQPTVGSSGSTKAASTPKWSKLVLAANVENARLSIDGNVLGAGNLTYGKIKPGRHSYVVSSTGYKSARGKINLTAGKTRTLTVKLVSTEPEVAASPDIDLYNSGKKKLQQGDFAAAIGDLDQAINIRPSYADALSARAKAHLLGRHHAEAYNDFVRAGDLYSGTRNSQAAMSNYGQAIKLDPKSVAGLLGRGNLYLSRGEEIAAIADFDVVVKLDKRNMYAYLGLGQARYKQGYYKKAIKHFKDARSLDSKNPAIHKRLMLSYFKAGNNKQVKKSLGKFIKYATDTEIGEMRADKRFAPILETITN